MVAVLDSMIQRNEQDSHVKKLMQIAKTEYKDVCLQHTNKSNLQGHQYDCGVLAVKNFEARLRGVPLGPGGAPVDGTQKVSSTHNSVH